MKLLQPLSNFLRLFSRLRTGYFLKLIVTVVIICVLFGTLYTLDFEYASLMDLTSGVKATQGAHVSAKIDASYYKKVYSLLSREKQYQYNLELKDTYVAPDAESEVQELTLEPLKTFINDSLIELLKTTKPTIKPINNPQHYRHKNKFKTSWDKKVPVLDGKIREDNIDDEVRTQEYLSAFLHMNQEEIDALNLSHKTFTSSIETLINDDLNFKGDGILYVGGSKYNWLVLLSLKQLRSVGSELPVEVFIPIKDESKSRPFCDEIFPKFNATCIYMSDFFSKKDRDFINNISNGYQYKSIALLVTSFERVLMLDSDNLPLANPDLFFVNEPFASKHFLIWPDFWRRSVSPRFYELAEIPISDTEQVRKSYKDDRGKSEDGFSKEDYFEKVSYHDLKGTIPECSSEAGTMLINKKVHFKTILLSVYYNYNGPKFYYGLFAQGQAGEGDKDTFIAAAHFWQLPYYQIQEYVREFGDVKDFDNFNAGDIDFEINAMGQYDPILDYIQTLDYEKFKSNYPYDPKKNNYFMHKFQHSQIAFLHTNLPKLYPWELQGHAPVRTIFAENGDRKRLYTLLIEELGYDMELKIWEIMSWFLCEYNRIYQEDYGVENKFKEVMERLFRGVDMENSCTIVREQVEFLKNGP